LDTSYNCASSVDKIKGRSTRSTKSFVIDTSRNYRLTSRRYIKEKSLIAGSTKSSFILNAEHISFIAFIVGTKIFIRFANQAHSRRRPRAAIRSNDQPISADQTAFFVKIGTIRDLT
jgi:hypothetical protein